MTSLWKLIGTRIPDDHSRQVTSLYYLRQALTGSDAPMLMVDLGCGAGATAQLAREIRPGIEWIGVDIHESEPAKAIEGEIFRENLTRQAVINSPQRRSRARRVAR